MIFQFKNIAPIISDSAYIAPSAIVIGNVFIKEFAGIWFQAVLRGDEEKIVIGNNTNVQDGCVLHTDPGFELTVGNGVTVGHKSILHGCFVSDNCLIGMNSVLLNGSKIGRNCIIGANTLIGKDKEIPDNSLVIGNPARRVRTINEDDIIHIKKAAEYYVERIKMYRSLIEVYK